MKSILISIKPRFVAKILNGEKTIEIRKTMPKCDLPIDVYIYCTKDKKYANLVNRGGFLTGMVVAKFTLNKVEEICACSYSKIYYIDTSYERSGTQIFKDSCLTFEELDNYLKMKKGYAWHISNLVIFDKPKELSEFYKVGYGDNAYDEVETMARESYIDMAYGFNLNGVQMSIDEDKLWKECEFIVKQKYQLSKAPQSMCYVEVEE